MNVAELRKHAKDLGFTPQDQVRWLAPAELVRTAIKVALSSTFAGYIDRREVQAALPKPPIEVAPDEDDGFWLDFVSDLGDGFDSTYTVALTLAGDRLGIAAPDGTELDLPRGKVLVLGGDQVYPTPSALGYEDRTRGPYRAALPAGSVADKTRRPLMLALPGNHDWYDGLTAFLRLFCQRRPIGAWRTEQTRSYFAAKLPNDWWLVGVDTQFGTYIDEPQIQYFREHLSSKLKPDDAVVICSPSPTWVESARGRPDAFNSLHWFEQHVVGEHRGEDGELRPTGAKVRLWLTGDLHHYSRYAEDLAGQTDDEGKPFPPESARQFITCGMGGSFVTETHNLPEKLVVPPEGSRLTTHAKRAKLSLQGRYPDPGLTRRLTPRVLSLGRFGVPMRNPGFWRLAGVVQAAAVLALANVLGVQMGMGPVAALRSAGLAEVVRLAWQSGVILVALTVFFTAVPLVRRQPPRAPYEAFIAIGLQLIVAFVGLLAATAVPWPASWPSWLILGVVLLSIVIIGGLVASYAFAVYMLASRARLVRGWLMAAQAIEDHKGFLRLHFDSAGDVTVYPIVIDTVNHDWELVDKERPIPAGPLPVPRLAEAPIRLSRMGAAGAHTPDGEDPGRPTARPRARASAPPGAPMDPDQASSGPDEPLDGVEPNGRKVPQPPPAQAGTTPS